MAGRKDQVNKSGLSEHAARLTLQEVRAQGHPYVEIRKDNEPITFFCILCVERCPSKQELLDHLNGGFHIRRYATAKHTFLASNPWPFNDGLRFFDNSHEENEQLTVVNADQSRLSEGVDVDSEVSADDKNLTNDGKDIFMVVPDVLLKDKIMKLGLKYLGLGQIGARFREKDGGPKEIVRIWCEWLGDKNVDDEDTFPVPEHDYAVINFKYHHELGLMSFDDDFKALICSDSGRKRKMALSEDVSDNLTKQYGSSKKGSVDSNIPSLRSLLDDESLLKKFIPSKSVRQMVKTKQRTLAKTTCDLCAQMMLRGKDAATILNMKNEKLACSSRNRSGVFHVFHMSCLIHWILLCEYEIHTNESVSPNEKKIHSVSCPECNGTGINLEGDKLEAWRDLWPTEKFNYIIKSNMAYRKWMESPEVLQNCSTGLYFPPQSEETAQEKVSSLKLLHFYGADA